MPRNRPIYLAREPSKLRFWSEILPELAPLPPLWGQGAGGWGVFDAPKKVVGRQHDNGGTEGVLRGIECGRSRPRGFRSRMCYHPARHSHHDER